MFGVGEATVSRLLRRYRDTGDVKAKPVGGNNPRRVELSWLQQHAALHPSARLKDRVQAWSEKSGILVCESTMCLAMQAIGYTHKKRHR